MKKLTILLTVFFFTFNSSAKSIEAKYEITYGSLINLGMATSTLDINGDKYSIIMKAHTTGISKFLTKNRIERYESHGKIIDNKFIPIKFIKIKQNDDKKRVRTYTFNHKEKKVLIHDLKIGNKKIVNIDLSNNIKKIHEEKTYILKYYAKDDILSLFFNLRKKLPTFKNAEEYTLKAVGANKTKGIINILMPSSKDLKEINTYLKTDDRSKFTAFINQKIFQSKRGELLISLNKEGFCSYAVLKDVILFGDIVGKMIEFKIKS